MKSEPSAGEGYFVKALDDCVDELFRKLRMGRADWDLNSVLREELLKHPDIREAISTLQEYDVLKDLADSYKIQISKDYNSIHNIWQLLNPQESSSGQT